MGYPLPKGLRGEGLRQEGLEDRIEGKKLQALGGLEARGFQRRGFRHAGFREEAVGKNGKKVQQGDSRRLGPRAAGYKLRTPLRT